MRTIVIIALSFYFLLTMACRQPGVELDELTDENQILLEFSFINSDNTVLANTSKAVINDSTVYVSLPRGTDRRSLVPRFEIRGKGLQVNGVWQISGKTAQDFTKPVLYDLVRADDSRVQYSVTAGYGNLGDTSLYDFSFRSDLNSGIAGTVSGVIDSTSVTLNFPFESIVGKMLPSFNAPPGAVVSYNGEILVSGSPPAIDPSDGGTLKVDFSDGSSRIYSFFTTIKAQDFVYVHPSGATNASGSQMNPLSTLDEAVLTAVGKNIPEIRVATGSYSLASNLQITQNLTIRGGYSSIDWSDRSFKSPAARTNPSYKTYISTSSSGSGTPTELLGSIIYSGSSVGSSSFLEGVVLAAGGGGNMTSAVSVLDGASPQIVFCDLLGGMNTNGAAAFVKGSSPSFFSSILRSSATGGSSVGVGLQVGPGGSPQVVSSYISSFNVGVPDKGAGILLEGSGASGVYYGNFIEGQGSVEGAAVKLTVPGGSFVNNIFFNASGTPGNFGFLESSSGNRPVLLQNNNFSTPHLGIPLYRRDGSVDITDSREINSLGYAGSDGNTGFRFLSYTSYMSDVSSKTIPPSVAYRGKTLSSIWTRDLYNNSRTTSIKGQWSMGPMELDDTSLDEETILVNDTGTDNYDGYWSSLDIREAITLVNTWGNTSVIVYPAGNYSVSMLEPLKVTSDLYFKGADGYTSLNGSSATSLFILDDGDSGNTLDVYFENVVFQNGFSSATNGGGILSRENLYIYDCLFSNNKALAGGALYQEGGELYIANTVFTTNSTTGGAGGAISVNNGSVHGINLVFDGNQLGGGMYNGGAVYLHDSPGLFLFSTFIDNQTPVGNGSLYSNGSDLYVKNSLFYANTASAYPDIDIVGGTLFLRGAIVETSTYADAPNQVVQVDPWNPLVILPATPAGTDSIWKSSPDGYELQSGTPAVNLGFLDFNYTDWPDADGDGNTTELFPYDILKNNRVINGVPDAGAYESSY